MPEQSTMSQDNPCREGYARCNAMSRDDVRCGSRDVTQGLHEGGLGVVRQWYEGSTSHVICVTQGCRKSSAKTIGKLTIILE